MADVVYGVRAALAVFQERVADIERVAFGAAARRELEPLLGWARKQGVPCKEAREDDLARQAQSHNHEGVCLVTRPRRFVALADLTELLLRRRGTALALDRVRNPYNVGAILRTAAFFGVDAVVLGAPAPHPGLAPDAVRVAEGGAERVAIARTTDIVELLGRLRDKGVAIVGADMNAPAELRGFSFSRPVVVVLGHEREGLSGRVRARCDTFVAIRGVDTVESLNVAVTAGVVAGELTRPVLRGRP